MNILLGFILSLFCLFTTKSYWKSLLIGAAVYCIVSFIVFVIDIPEGSHLNINSDSVLSTIAMLLGEFMVPFLFACLVYIFSSFFKRKKEPIKQESEDTVVIEKRTNYDKS